MCSWLIYVLFFLVGSLEYYPGSLVDKLLSTTGVLFDI